jgi:hypothetical protein
LVYFSAYQPQISRMNADRSAFIRIICGLYAEIVAWFSKTVV